MKIMVKARAGAKREGIKELNGPIGGGERILEVAVKELPKQGRANEAITKALAEYFGVSKSKVNLVSGFSSKQKIFEVE